MSILMSPEELQALHIYATHVRKALSETFRRYDRALFQKKSLRQPQSLVGDAAPLHDLDHLIDQLKRFLTRHEVPTRPPKCEAPSPLGGTPCILARDHDGAHKSTPGQNGWWIETPAPVEMILSCPMCHTRHVDRGVFATKVHHTHACQGCGHCWRPAVVATVGVQFLPGFKDRE
jgi:hypothetical protein